MQSDQFGYQPALDGLRGVAVTLVLLFHGGFTWMAGGYVGVSVFFTLSGFLITSLLIVEHQRTGSVSWSGFVARRAKRLLPASLLCLVGISLLAWAGEFATVPHLRRDVIASALQVANWNALDGTGSYADLLSRASGVSSPVDHFWSLAVEEQFYWVWPFAFLLLLRVSKGRRQLFVNLTALAVVGIVAARVIAQHWGPDVAYWATPARLGEILVGAALGGGCLLWRRRSRWLGLLGVAGLAVVLWAAIEWPTRGGPAYDGWLGVFSLASAALILGLQAPGVVRSVFSLRPLVWLGRISYGVYVFHWPVFLLASGRSLNMGGWSLFLVRIVITLVLAVASYWLVERPVRRSSRRPRVALASVVPVSALVVLLAVMVVPAQPGQRRAVAPAGTTTTSTTTIAASPVAGGGPASVPGVPTTSASTTSTTLPAGPVNVVLIGDSTAFTLEDGLEAWAAETTNRTIGSVAIPGCGLITGTAMDGDINDFFTKGCNFALGTTLPELLTDQRPDIALIMVSIPDVSLRQWSSDEGMLPPTDERYAQRLLSDYRAMVARLMSAGVRHIVWVVPPTPSSWWLGWEADTNYGPDAWKRLLVPLQVMNREFPTVVEVARLDEWFVTNGESDNSATREDGLHLTPSGAVRVMDEFLGPVLLRLSAV